MSFNDSIINRNKIIKDSFTKKDFFIVNNDKYNLENNILNATHKHYIKFVLELKSFDIKFIRCSKKQLIYKCLGVDKLDHNCCIIIFPYDNKIENNLYYIYEFSKLFISNNYYHIHITLINIKYNINTDTYSLLENNIFNNIFSLNVTDIVFMVKEYNTYVCSVNSHFKKTTNHIKYILFQIIFTLLFLLKKYDKNITLNNLLTCNILVDIYNIPFFKHYNIDNKNYKITDCYVTIKLYDFSLCRIQKKNNDLKSLADDVLNVNNINIDNDTRQFLKYIKNIDGTDDIIKSNLLDNKYFQDILIINNQSGGNDKNNNNSDTPSDSNITETSSDKSEMDDINTLNDKGDTKDINTLNDKSETDDINTLNDKSETDDINTLNDKSETDDINTLNDKNKVLTYDENLNNEVPKKDIKIKTLSDSISDESSVDDTIELNNYYNKVQTDKKKDDDIEINEPYSSNTEDERRDRGRHERRKDDRHDRGRYERREDGQHDHERHERRDDERRDRGRYERRDDERGRRERRDDDRGRHERRDDERRDRGRYERRDDDRRDRGRYERRDDNKRYGDDKEKKWDKEKYKKKEIDIYEDPLRTYSKNFGKSNNIVNFRNANDPYEQRYSSINLFTTENQIHEIPRQQIYNVSLDNPLGRYSDIYKIYEHKNIEDKILKYFDTITDRIDIIIELRGLLEKDKFKNLQLLCNGKNNLLSNLQVINNTPLMGSKFICNDYIRYLSAYPIKLDTKTRFIKNADNCSHFYVKIYQNPLEDFYDYCKNINIKENNLDIYIEYFYYQKIFTEIFIKKVSPNFLNLISLCIDNNSRINWNKTNEGKAVDLSNDAKKNKSMILVTEAPTIALSDWSKYYHDNSKFGNHNLISSGYHSSDTHISIIFQMLYSLLALTKHKIIFKNINHENFNIRYITTMSKNSRYQYIIDNLSYYIPCNGNMLVFDSQYNKTDVMGLPEKYIKFNDMVDLQYYKYFFNSVVALFNTVTFTNHNTTNFHPDITILLNNIKYKLEQQKILLESMNVNTDNKIINEFIQKSFKNCLFEINYFNKFLHPRLGSPLMKNEKELLSLITNSEDEYKKIKNKLVAYEIRSDEYKWVIYLHDCEDLFNKRIITKEYETYIHKNVHNSTLRLYNGIPLPIDEYDNIHITDIDIIDTYNIDY